MTGGAKNDRGIFRDSYDPDAEPRFNEPFYMHMLTEDLHFRALNSENLRLARYLEQVARQHPDTTRPSH